MKDQKWDFLFLYLRGLGKLKDFTYDTLLSQNLFIHQYFDKKIIKQYLDEHVSHKKDWQYKLWSLVVFQIWSNKNK